MQTEPRLLVNLRVELTRKNPLGIYRGAMGGPNPLTSLSQAASRPQEARTSHKRRGDGKPKDNHLRGATFTPWDGFPGVVLAQVRSYWLDYR